MAMFDFLTVGKALKNFAADLSAIRLEQETLARELEDIQYAPAHPDDLVKALEVWAADNELEYQAYLKLELTKLSSRPSMLTSKSEVKNHLRSRGFLPEPSPSVPMSLDVQMCGLLGAAGFTELLKKQMQAISWPEPGLPMTARPAAIEALKKKIAVLNSRETALIEAADKAGLVVS